MLPSLVNLQVILGSQHPFSFNFYFMLIKIFSKKKGSLELLLLLLSAKNVPFSVPNSRKSVSRELGKKRLFRLKLQRTLINIVRATVNS